MKDTFLAYQLQESRTTKSKRHASDFMSTHTGHKQNVLDAQQRVLAKTSTKEIAHTK